MAFIFSVKNSNFSVFTVIDSNCDKSLSNVNIRRVYGMNVVGIKPQGSPKMTMDFSADYIIQPGDHFLVVSKTKEVEKWDFLTKE